MTEDINSVNMLVRREIEALVAGPMIKAFSKEFVALGHFHPHCSVKKSKILVNSCLSESSISTSCSMIIKSTSLAFSSKEPGSGIEHPPPDFLAYKSTSNMLSYGCTQEQL